MANWLKLSARTRASLDPWLPSQGSALLVSVRTRELIAAGGAAAAAAELIPPGSTLKPFVLEALLRSGKLRPDDELFCTGELRIAGRSFACSHPRLASPIDISSALAYSCNYFVAHFAQRFERGELALALQRAGFGSLPGLLGPAEVSGHILPVAGPQANQLQALGEDQVWITLAGLALGYRTLALTSSRPEMSPILNGLEGAVEYGTARQAWPPGLQKAGVRVAGKTGTARAGGRMCAWFAGFATIRAPEVVVAVMLQGRSGGADAAPVAGRILEAWRSGNIP